MLNHPQAQPAVGEKSREAAEIMRCRSFVDLRQDKKILIFFHSFSRGLNG